VAGELAGSGAAAIALSSARSPVAIRSLVGARSGSSIHWIVSPFGWDDL
jgi:hypothetical protein